MADGIITFDGDSEDLINAIDRIEKRMAGLAPAVKKLNEKIATYGEERSKKEQTQYNKENKELTQLLQTLKSLSNTKQKMQSVVTKGGSLITEAGSATLKRRKQEILDFVSETKDALTSLVPIGNKASSALSKGLTNIGLSAMDAPGKLKKNLAYARKLLDKGLNGEIVTLKPEEQHLKKIFDAVLLVKDATFQAAQQETRRLEILQKESAELTKQASLKRSANLVYKNLTNNLTGTPEEKAAVGAKVKPIAAMVQSGQLTTGQIHALMNRYHSGGVDPQNDTEASFFKHFAALNKADANLGKSDSTKAKALIKAQEAQDKLDAYAVAKTKAQQTTAGIGMYMLNDAQNRGVNYSTDEAAKVKQAVHAFDDLFRVNKLTEQQFHTLWTEFQQGSFMAIEAIDPKMVAMFRRLTKAAQNLGMENYKATQKLDKQNTKVDDAQAKVVRSADANTFVNRVDAGIAKPASSNNKEKAALASSLKGMEQWLSTSKITFQRAEELARHWANGVDLSTNKAERAFVVHAQAVAKASSNLGAQQRADAERTAKQQQALAMSTSSQYESSMQRTVKAVLSGGTLIRLFLIQNLHMIMGQTTNQIFDMVRSLRQLELQIAQIRTISDKGQLSTAAWTDGIIKFANSLGIDELELAAGVYQTISNQVTKGAEALVFASKAATLARVGIGTTAQAVDLMSSAVNSFGYSAYDADAIAAQLFSTIDQGRFSIEELSNVYGRVAPVASQLGMSMGELNASLAVLSNKGVKINEAATQLSGIMQKLLRPTKELDKVLKEQGYSSGVAAVQTLGLVGTLEMLQEQAAKSGDELHELTEFFNEVRGFRGVVVFDNKGRQQLQDAQKLIENSMERYRQAQAEIMNTLTVKIDQKLGSLKTYAYETVLKPFLIDLNAAVDKADGLIKIFDSLRGLVGNVNFKEILSSTSIMEAGFVSIKQLMSSPAVQGLLIYKGLGLARGILEDTYNKQRLLSESWVKGLTEVERQQLLVDRGFKTASISATIFSGIISFGITAAIGVVTYQITKYLAAQEQLRQESEQSFRSLKEQYSGLKESQESAIRLEMEAAEETRKANEKKFRSLSLLVSNAQQALNKISKSDEEVWKNQKSYFNGYIKDVERGFDKMSTQIDRAVDKFKKMGEQIQSILAQQEIDSLFQKFETDSQTMDPSTKLGRAQQLQKEASGIIKKRYDAGDISEGNSIQQRVIDVIVNIGKEGGPDQQATAQTMADRLRKANSTELDRLGKFAATSSVSAETTQQKVHENQDLAKNLLGQTEKFELQATTVAEAKKELKEYYDIIGKLRAIPVESLQTISRDKLIAIQGSKLLRQFSSIQRQEEINNADKSVQEAKARETDLIQNITNNKGKADDTAKEIGTKRIDLLSNITKTTNGLFINTDQNTGKYFAEKYGKENYKDGNAYDTNSKDLKSFDVGSFANTMSAMFKSAEDLAPQDRDKQQNEIIKKLRGFFADVREKQSGLNVQFYSQFSQPFDVYAKDGELTGQPKPAGKDDRVPYSGAFKTLDRLSQDRQTSLNTVAEYQNQLTGVRQQLQAPSYIPAGVTLPNAAKETSSGDVNIGEVIINNNNLSNLTDKVVQEIGRKINQQKQRGTIGLGG